MLRIQNLAKAYGSRTLFRDVDWQTSPGQRIGLVGPNGVGKSTLFRIIVGEEEADDGEVNIPKRAAIGYLPQEITVESNEPLLPFILEGARHILDMEDRLSELERRLGEVAGTDDAIAVNEEYGALQDQFRRRGGYAIRSTAREIAAGMGFSTQDFEQSLQSFSGGWRMRALLCRLLLRRPEVLLLDEPTNHLDLESIEWLEGFINQYEGCVVVISHDRYFLNKIVTEIAELRTTGMRTWKGGYDRFLEQREQEQERIEAAAERQQAEVERIEDFIDRFRYKATKAKQVQSRVKMLERMDMIEVPEFATTSLAFRFPEPERLPKVVMEISGVRKAYGDNVVYESLDFMIARGDKLALVGPNGAGKSTLLKLLAGVIEADAGEVRLANGVEFAYFAQHSVEQLDLSRTILEEMVAYSTHETSGKERDILGAFGFAGNDAVKRKISVLSGGEKTRLALAKLMLRPSGVLLLDEPTNHLDIASRQVLEEAIRQFGGAVCIVSHDRFFLNEVVERVVHIEHGDLTEYLGDYDYYKWSREQLLAEEQGEGGDQGDDGLARTSTGALTKKELRRVLAELRERRMAESGDLRAEVTSLEKRIEEGEARKAELEAMMADPEIYQDAERLPEVSREYNQLGEEIVGLMERWEEKLFELEEIDERYEAEEAALRGDL